MKPTVRWRWLGPIALILLSGEMVALSATREAQSPEVRALIEAKAPAATIATASLAAQRRMGLREAQLRVLSDSQVATMAETLRTTGPDKADMTHHRNEFPRQPLNGIH